MIKTYLFSIMLVAACINLAHAQSFQNIDELLQLSEMDPLAFEKSVTEKGFSFESTDGIESVYKKNYPYESLRYTISPRRVNYYFMDRIFSLEVVSRLLKSGFILEATEGVLEVSGKKVKAQKYVKDKFIVWVWMTKDEGSPLYHIQIDNSKPLDINRGKAAKKGFKYKGEKESISFGYWSVGYILSKGILTEDAKKTSVKNPFSGNSGIKLENGFETNIGGIIGLNGLNKRLPHAMDFGIILNGQFSSISYSLEDHGSPYTAYSYDDFIKFGAGIGPSFTLTPFREFNFHISAFYKIEAAGNWGGGYESNGIGSNSETLMRDAGSFAWAKSYGFILHGQWVFFSTEFTKYTDEGEFSYKRTYYDPNTAQKLEEKNQFTAALPFSQITLRIGMVFR